MEAIKKATAFNLQDLSIELDPTDNKNYSCIGFLKNDSDFGVCTRYVCRDVVALRAKPQKPVLQGQKTKQS